MNDKDLAEVLRLKAVVEFETPIDGPWNGGRKSVFEFKPKVDPTKGKPAIRWGSFGANYWFSLNQGKNLKSHLTGVRRKLRGAPKRRIEFQTMTPDEIYAVRYC
jgi:hypothetical protein